MPRTRALVLAVWAASLNAVLAAIVAQALAHPPNAQPGHGTEGAFATGLYPRELVAGRGPMRWTRDHATFRFERLSDGPAELEVRIRGHATPVRVAVSGRLVGVIEAGRFVGRYPIPQGPERGAIVVDLVTEGFPGGDGVRGALVDRVKVIPQASRRPRATTVLLFVLPALLAAVLGVAAGLRAPSAAGVAAALVLLQALLLSVDGQLFSPYARTLAGEIALAVALAAVLARAFERRVAGSGRGAYLALLLALVVQGIAAASPVMVASDVVFHANQVRHAAAGDWFPTSVTQHQTPFEIPYGVSFYALLVPLFRLGFDPVLLVSIGAGLAGVVASVALFGLLVRRDLRLAVAATVALQLLPGTFTIYSYGNLSNAFGQAVTVLFFCWWAGAAAGGALAGGVLLAVAGISHLSSFIVVVALVAGLWVARGPALRGDRGRLGALALGGLAIAAYYSHFVPLVLRQLPRLLEGGGQGRPGSSGPVLALVHQASVAIAQFGLPALWLALAGAALLRASGAFRESGPLRDVAAAFVSVAALALPAVISPLEVRYLYALTLPLAVAAGAGYLRLGERSVAGRTVADLLALAQAAIAAYVIADCLFFRYRQ
jgi:hypothetical protein